jgi:hypothetical protein
MIVQVGRVRRESCYSSPTILCVRHFGNGNAIRDPLKTNPGELLVFSMVVAIFFPPK